MASLALYGDPDRMPPSSGWGRFRNQPMAEARRFGRRWQAEARSCVLIVPSVVARVERNIVVNPAHADFGQSTTGLETPVWRDDGLFSGRAARGATP